LTENNKLRLAYSKAKQGDKEQALAVIKSVLKDDPDNGLAWWTAAQIFDDEDKVVKALERVLKINPDHEGAKQKLAQLRPEYSHFKHQETKALKKKTSAGTGNPLQNHKFTILAIALGLIVLIGIVSLLSGILSSKNPINYTETRMVDWRELYELPLDNMSGVVNVTARRVDRQRASSYGILEYSIYLTRGATNIYIGEENYQSAIFYLRLNEQTSVYASSSHPYRVDNVELTVTRADPADIQVGTIEVGQSMDAHINRNGVVEFILNANRPVTITLEESMSSNPDFEPVLVVYNARNELIATAIRPHGDTTLSDIVLEDLQVSGRTYIQVRDRGANSPADITLTVE